MSEIPFPPLKLAQSHYRLLLPWRLYVDHSHCPVLAPATLAVLPSTRAIPDRDVFYVAFPKSSIVSRLLDRYLTALPAMSLAPVAPFPSSRRVLCRSSHSLHCYIATSARRLRLMGHSQGRDNAKKRARRRKKTERLALAKKKTKK